MLLPRRLVSFLRKPTSGSPRRVSARPQVERLEARDVPTASFYWQRTTNSPIVDPTRFQPPYIGVLAINNVDSGGVKVRLALTPSPDHAVYSYKDSNTTPVQSETITMDWSGAPDIILPGQKFTIHEKASGTFNNMNPAGGAFVVAAALTGDPGGRNPLDATYSGAEGLPSEGGPESVDASFTPPTSAVTNFGSNIHFANKIISIEERGNGGLFFQYYYTLVQGPPVITSSNAVTFTVGDPNNTFTVQTGGSKAKLDYSGDLPKGVKFDKSTGILSGSPDPSTAGAGPKADGSYPLTFTATNGIGSFQQPFSLTILPKPDPNDVWTGLTKDGKWSDYRTWKGGVPKDHGERTSKPI
jgi:hypothetical protein